MPAPSKSLEALIEPMIKRGAVGPLMPCGKPMFSIGRR